MTRLILLAIVWHAPLRLSGRAAAKRDPVLVSQCREEAETFVVLTTRDPKSRSTVRSDVLNRRMRRGAPDHR
ncbi:MAG TPA: hypothetical protein VHM01_11135 [Alphaproteobacteria bacterium]|nr:hypothetical protein [Alphaproteobacteria bacterium]